MGLIDLCSNLDPSLPSHGPHLSSLSSQSLMSPVGLAVLNCLTRGCEKINFVLAKCFGNITCLNINGSLSVGKCAPELCSGQLKVGRAILGEPGLHPRSNREVVLMKE